MDPERTAEYIRSLEQDPPELLAGIRREAEAAHVPVIRVETAALLRTLIAMKRPAQILEAGTAVGYSALVMCAVMPAGSHITTIEINEQRIAAARNNFRRCGEEQRITLVPGDAAEVLPALTGPFDFIFMDAAKGQYPNFLPQVLRLLPEGGVLVTDNIFQNGTLLESRYAVPRRERTIHARMRTYLSQLKREESLETALLPVGDGVAVSVRRTR